MADEAGETNAADAESGAAAAAAAADAGSGATPSARQIVISSDPRELTLFIVTGEHSGDHLGAKLMAAIQERRKGRVRFLGVGGEMMEREGLVSQFPLADVAVMGPLSILPRLPRITRRVYRTVDAVIAAKPDALVIIDAPEFTHAIAKRVRQRQPSIPIVDYVSPTVWAWRPGRARVMKAYVDHLLALLPFEPAAHARLGGPPCSYVGHPLIERIGEWRSVDPRPLADRLGLAPGRPVLLVLPGSRASEVGRLLRPFREAIVQLERRGQTPELLLPAVGHLRERIERETAHWPRPVHVLQGEADKRAAFRLATAALAASGTVTLELALAQVPMVVAYRVDALAARLRFLVKVPSIVLANLVLEENVFPEFIQEACRGDLMADALGPLLGDTPERARQLAGLARIESLMRLPDGTPSDRAAEIVLSMTAQRG